MYVQRSPYFKVYSTAHQGATRTSVHEKAAESIQQLAVVPQKHDEIIK